jgi:hypothetical protein
VGPIGDSELVEAVLRASPGRYSKDSWSFTCTITAPRYKCFSAKDLSASVDSWKVRLSMGMMGYRSESLLLLGAWRTCLEEYS